MNTSQYYFLNSETVNWTAIIALGVSIISLIYTAWYGRKTFNLTKKHYIKTVEPLLTDLYTINNDKDNRAIPLHSYDIKNSGFGPAVMKTLTFTINEKSYRDIHTLISDTFHGNFNLKFHIMMSVDDMVISPNEKLNLFEIHLTSQDFEEYPEFQNLLSQVSLHVEYETIYSEKRFLHVKNIFKP